MSIIILKCGNSAAQRLPKNELENLTLHIGDKVNLIEKGNTLIIKPSIPSLDELLSQVTIENRHEAELTDKIGNERF